MNERILRLTKLIEHWAEHNDEHGQRYGESAADAEDMGLKAVAMELVEAHMKTKEVSEHLRNALIRIKEGSN
jgi:hypothetical protein